jgi:ribosomal protein L11 methyltransferase
MELTRNALKRETLSLCIAVAERDEEAASAILWELGTDGIEIRESASGAVQLIAYFGPNTPTRLANVVASRLQGFLREPIVTLPVTPVDWNALWRRSFQPVTIGSLTIAPPWNTPDIPGERLIVIDPGRSFGTGAHETTQLCLELVELLAHRAPLGSVLDVGTGTGVLAIAAARLGADFVAGVDIDNDALQSARSHAKKNNVDLSIVHADGSGAFRSSSFDIVIANLAMPFFTERYAELRFTARRHLVLSGFLADDIESLDVKRPDQRSTFHIRGEWAALLQDLT